MSDLNLDALAEKANAATPGPWLVAPEVCGPEGMGVYNEDGGPICEVGDPYPRGKNHPTENMRYIAAFSPDVALALIARIRQLEGDLTKLGQLLDAAPAGDEK